MSWRERLATLEQKAKLLRRDTLALWFAARDPRTPRLAKLVTALVVAYALSPIDLIPDFIPVLGLLDELVLLPLGIALALRLMPATVLADARARADMLAARPRSWLGATLIVLLWLAIASVCGWWLYRELA